MVVNLKPYIEKELYREITESDEERHGKAMRFIQRAIKAGYRMSINSGVNLSGNGMVRF